MEKFEKDRFLLVGHDTPFSSSVAEAVGRYRECEVIEAGSLDTAACQKYMNKKKGG